MALSGTSDYGRSVSPEASAAARVADDDFARRMRRIENLEHWLDRQFKLPIVGKAVGWDGIMGLVPVLGDTVAGGLSAYLIWEAHKAGADTRTKAKMIGHVGLDYLIGLVPVVGWVADFFYKANTKNLRLLKEHLAEEDRRRRGGMGATKRPG